MRSLLKYFAPDHYRLYFSIDTKDKTFSTTTSIHGDNKAGEIKLHCKGLEVLDVCDNETITPDDLAPDSIDGWHLEDDILSIPTKSNHITIFARGKLSDTAMNGLYLCKYREDNEDKYLFATQFESHYARQCFPCVDEPAAKAQFQINIRSHDNFPTVLSNMPGRYVVRNGNVGCWEFETTPCMSPYLVAFVGGNLIHKSAKTSSGTEVSIYATPAQDRSTLDYPLVTAVKSIEFYEDYFGVKYPLAKLDNIALPDFSAGAMENWGLITYRETSLLANDKSSQGTREYVATTIAHEIAHQWFGNLVTMQWWNDLWLNESFANLMEYIAVDHIYPDYNIWNSYNTSYVDYALNQDAIPGIQSVQQDIETEDEIAGAFDAAIAYGKGSRLVEMVRQYIGEDRFRHGLTNYFSKYAYQNATASDLWSEMDKASGLEIGELMTPWLTRPNYPVIHASLSGNTLHLKQSEFLIGTEPDKDKLWSIPLFSNLSNAPKLMTEKTLDISIKPDELVLLNTGNHAHFITMYDDELLSRLTNNFDSLQVVDRYQLLRESMLLSHANLQSIKPSLDVAKHLDDENKYLVLSAVSSIISDASVIAEPDTPEDACLRDMARQVFAKPYDRFSKVDTASSNINDIKARTISLAQSVYGRNQTAIQYCIDKYLAYRNDLAEINPDERATILATVVRESGNYHHFKHIWQCHCNTQDADLQEDYMTALTATKKASNAEFLLDKAKDPSSIRTQDAISFIARLLYNPHHRALTWRWIRDNWGWVKSTYGGDMDYNSFIMILGYALKTQRELDEFDKFTHKISEPALEQNIAVARADITARIEWIERNKKHLTNNSK